MIGSGRRSNSLLLALGLAVFLTALGLAGPAPGQDDRPLTVYYFDRAPYYIQRNGQPPTGFLVEITRAVFQRAGISHRFVEQPSKRILNQIREKEYSCSVGWFKNEEREAFARFSEPIYQDQPQAVVVRRAEVESPDQGVSLEQMLDGPLRLGLVDGFSYGQWADRKLARRPDKAYRLTGVPEQLFSMILQKRIDFTLVAPEEAFHLFQEDPDFRENLRLLPIRDAPKGNLRYIIYSLGVDPELIRRIDRALAEYRNTDEYRWLTAFDLSP